MLKGENVTLRPLKIEDLEKTHEWRNNLELVRMTQGVKFPKTLEMDREWFEVVLHDKSNKNIYFGIDEILTNNFIGIVQLNNLDYLSRTAELGFVIGDVDRHRKGYGYEFCNLVLEYAFNFLNLRKITSYVVEHNVASINLFKKLLFVQEGMLKSHVYMDNEYYDINIMSLFKEKFNVKK